MAFWRKAGPDKWFDKDAAFDNHFHDRFRDAHFAAARRELDDWLEKAESSLALMLLLDQFPRNCFRGTAHMYATDPLARLFADEAIRRGHDQALGEICASFYLPFSHAEDLRIRSVPALSTSRLAGFICTMPKSIAISSSASAVFRTATTYWCGKRRRRNGYILMKAVFPAEPEMKTPPVERRRRLS